MSHTCSIATLGAARVATLLRSAACPISSGTERRGDASAW
jgi:hypothetical protein